MYGPGLSLGRWQGESQARYGSLSMNVVRALVQTAASSLLQNPPPRPWFLTDGADWETQKRARGMTRLAEGALARVRFDEQARGDALISAALASITVVGAVGGVLGGCSENPVGRKCDLGVENPGANTRSTSCSTIRSEMTKVVTSRRASAAASASLSWTTDSMGSK